MELEARSPVVATKSLSQAQAARLVAAECYRHKLDHMVLTTHCTILWRMSAAMITYFNGNAQPNNFEARDLAAHDPMDQPPWYLQRHMLHGNWTSTGFLQGMTALLLPSQFRQTMAPVRLLRLLRDSPHTFSRGMEILFFIEKRAAYRSLGAAAL